MNPFRPCPRCSTQNPPSNDFCGCCGTRLRQPTFTPGIKLALIGLGVVALGGLALLAVAVLDPKALVPPPPPSTLRGAAPQATPAAAPTPAPTPLPAAEVLERAKALAGEGASREELGRAVDMLGTIPKEAKEYKAAQPLLEKTRKRWARLAAEELVLGPKPENSGWNGKVHCVDLYLKKTLNDYGSSEYLEWSPVVRVDVKGEPYWSVKLKLRAKNAFGAYIVKDVLFLIRQNEVVSSVGLEG